VLTAQRDLGPIARPRRLRANAAMRALVRETRVNRDGLVQPLFIVAGSDVVQPIGSMPGVSRYSVDTVVRECRDLDAVGVRAVLLFGIPDAAQKDAYATVNYDPNGIVQRAARAIKSALPHLLVIADLCNCEYTDHGHCGILDETGDVDNDRTLEVLAKTALSYAHSGVDIVAPSDMMDGRVAAIRRALDDEGFTKTAIMSYAAKYASAFYGPFREAAESTPAFGDRRTYQMDPPNVREALKEVRLDIEEGADIVMVKPAMAYLDVVRAVREMTDLPVAVYHVSGEYAMLKAAAERGWIDEERAIDETLSVLTAREGKELRLAAAHFAGHPVIMPSDSRFVSADYPGRLVRDIERDQPGAQGMFFNGNLGDINPKVCCQGVDAAQDVGRALSAATRQVAEGISAKSEGEVGFATVECDLELDVEFAKREAQEYLFAGKIPKDHGYIACGSLLRNWAHEILGTIASGMRSMRIQIQAVRVGDTAFVAIPGEPYTIIGDKIRKDSPFKHTLVTSCANGSIGYSCEPRDYEEGTYGAIMVPKILGYPPFTADAWEQVSVAGVAALKKL